MSRFIEELLGTGRGPPPAVFGRHRRRDAVMLRRNATYLGTAPGRGSCMDRVQWVLGAPLIMAVVVVLGFPPPAMAGCHAFTVAVSPGRVVEGGTVMVIVRRDAGLAPSQVDIETVAETAQAGADFVELRQTVFFGFGPTEQSLSVPTTDDDSPEGSETFRLHLSNPAGCAVNPNLTVGPDSTATIDDNDAPTEPPPTEPPPTEPTGTEPPGTVASTTTAPTTTTTLPGTTTTSAGESTSTTGPRERTGGPGGGSSDGDNGGGGGRGPMALLAAAIAAVVGAIDYRLWRGPVPRSGGT
ncbi:MAG: Calx-beta domain-containing protein [Acidimicrobiales bacterium]